MAETAISTAVDSETLKSVGDPPSVHPSSDDLVAKGIAPVKPEYLLPPPPARTKSASGGAGADDDTSERKGFVKEKKSKRQAKRERLQEQKSALNICSQVAKKGSVDGCRYGANCRLSHDINAFLAMKPADMEGTCPFLNVEEPCPYGIACRFSGTHKQQTMSENENHSKLSHEINNLSKDLQKLLWKNKVSYPRANSQLKLLGLKDIEKYGTNKVENQEAKSVTCAETDCVEDSTTIDDSRPLKKVKNPSNEQLSSAETTNGISTMEIDPDKLTAENGKEKILDDSRFSSGTDLASESHPREKKLIDFSGKLYLAPLTTVGNLPFRRVCKALGADITCGEMAMASNLLQGQASEWALLRRHSSEDIFGVQICGSYPDTIARAVELVDRECQVDFIDINMGCPIDIVVNKGAGSSLITHPMRVKGIIQAANGTTDKPITVKVRTGYFEGRNLIDALISDISNWGASAVTIHGRSRQQRYSKLADWNYIYHCTRKAPYALQVIGNGDIFSFSDWNKHTSESEISTCMIARGALVKPWIFTEIKEQRDWDISSGERFNFLKDYVKYGLQHWGSDTKGVETTRHFLLGWLSYTYRYIPVGLLDVIPQRLNWRPPTYYGRDDLETLMASDSAADWVRISEMLLGKVPEGFTFAPKHKSNAYDRADNG